MKRIFILLLKLSIGFLALIGIMAILARCTPDGLNTLKLQNDSGQIISKAKITLRDRVCSVSSLQSPGYVKCYFGSMGDNSYKVSIMLEDGTNIESGSIGYVTNGMDSKHLLIINSAGKMELEFED